MEIDTEKKQMAEAINILLVDGWIYRVGDEECPGCHQKSNPVQAEGHAENCALRQGIEVADRIREATQRQEQPNES